jgi:FAD/FMN-containing dehydrogenase
MNRSDEYEKKKRALLEQFRKNLAQNSPLSLKKKNSNLFRDRNTKGSSKLDVRQLNQLISIDPVGQIAEVEGMLTYEDFVAETLKQNLLPPVVPQLKTITVGGALVGLGIESSSFRYGLVHETILEVEVLTSEGKVLTCTPSNEHSDLCYALPNSYGTLGIVLKIKLQLIPAKKFVRLTHLHFNHAKPFFDKLKEPCPTDYIDAVIFNKNEMAIVLATFVDEAPYASDYTYMKKYYTSIQARDEDYLTTHDYIWRWDPDWFWCSKHFGMNHPILRFVFGKLMLHSKSYWAINRFVSSHPRLKALLNKFSKPSETVIQDILVPIEKAEEFYTFFEKSIGITPIWICPFRPLPSEKSYSLFQIGPNALYLDFGFWDIVPSKQPAGYLNRLIEKKTEEVGGFKSLYSDSFYTKEQFWKIYSQDAFNSLKEKYDPKAVFQNLYEKCVQKG